MTGRSAAGPHHGSPAGTVAQGGKQQPETTQFCCAAARRAVAIMKRLLVTAVVSKPRLSQEFFISMVFFLAGTAAMLAP
jgi:hypothetical protein